MPGYELVIRNIYNGIARWGGPVFVMISGALFLPRQIDARTVWRRYIPRLAVAFVVWSALYALAFPVARTLLWHKEMADLPTILSDFVIGEYHLWFVPMLIGLYMCIPIFNKICEAPAVRRYYLILSFVAAFVIPWTLSLATVLLPGTQLLVTLNTAVSNAHLDILCGFGFCFVWGHHLNTAEISKKQRCTLCLLGATGPVMTALLNILASLRSGIPEVTFSSNFSVNLALAATGIFVLFKDLPLNNEKLNGFVAKLDRYTFGAYLVHAFILSVLQKIVPGIDPALRIPVDRLCRDRGLLQYFGGNEPHSVRAQMACVRRVRRDLRFNKKASLRRPFVLMPL